MRVSPEEAQSALEAIHQATAQTRHLLRAWLYSALACGVIWTIVFALAQWQSLTPIWAASETMLVGIVCSAIFAQRRLTIIRYAPGSQGAFVQSRLPLFYGLLYAFFLLWQFVFALPEMQLAVLWVTVVMLAMITTGMLLQQRLFVILGIAITALTAVGYWAVPQYFWVWLAVCAGLPLVGVSLYLLRRP